MALTRRQLGQNSRQLRFGRSILRHAAHASDISRVGKVPSSFKPPSKRHCRAGTSSPSRPNIVRAQVLHGNIEGDVIAASASADPRSDKGETGRDIPETGEEQHDAFTSYLRASSRADIDLTASSASTHGQPAKGAEEDKSRSTSPAQPSQEGLSDLDGNAFGSLEDVGIPTDGAWDHTAAYEQKFCYDHGEFEYLLGVADRWMSAKDFGRSNTQGALEAMLRKQREKPSVFDPRSRRCQAECGGSLFSHVFTVIDKREAGGRMLYLVRWKACWTPRPNIDDMAWIVTSMEANKDPRRRHCARLTRSLEESKAKYDRIMMVVKLG